MSRCVLVLALALLLPAFSGAQEFRVNTVTTGYQRNVRAAADAHGDFVVVWDSTAIDGSGSGVVGQRFDVDGLRVGGEFQINSYTTAGQFLPDVASDPEGGFVVVWQSFFQDGDYTSVHGQRFDSAGAPAGGEFQANLITTSFQEHPDVAVAPDGDFVVVWKTRWHTDGRIRARIYDSAGNPLGGEIPVDPAEGGSHPAVATDGDGNFVIVFTEYPFPAPPDIVGRRFDADGNQVGGRFQVNSYTTGYQRYPEVALEEDGGFVVVWESLYQDGDLFGVAGRRFDANATPQGSEFRINTYTTGSQNRPRVDVDVDGFRVAWGSSAQQDGSGWAVMSRLFDAQGGAVGAETLVNAYTTGTQWDPAVLGADGGFYVFWESQDQDGDDTGVYGRYLATPIFADGFESGDTSAW